ncbi:MAG TPA: redox-sensing transcriptional repressor Rex [Firmicutes bacterium]|jgi:redox-sensing transcriptional repressor|nr:redox-sensing transcriptional repressor Rex [Bacillota bacterium]
MHKGMNPLKDPVIKVTKFTLKRLPHYYRFVSTCLDKGLQFISSEEIAKGVQINAVQIRRDLMMFEAIGTPGVGYSVEELHSKLGEVLGLKNVNEAVIIGIGRLGRAIIDYPGFERYGLKIVGLFDSDPGVIATKINGKEIFAVDELEHIVGRLHIKIGIITVPDEWAQSVADTLIKSGVKAIWNFAPVDIRVPEDVVVRNEDLAAGLATLCHLFAGKSSDGFH